MEPRHLAAYGIMILVAAVMAALILRARRGARRARRAGDKPIRIVN